MTDTYRVDVVKFGQWDWAPGFEMFWMEPGAADEPLALVGVVIRGGGKTVVVNCGPDPAFLPTMNARWAGFDPRHQLRVKEEERLEPALAAVGVGLDDVDVVLVTPFQAYAIGNVLRFPRAEIGLSRRGWIDFHAPRWREHPHDFRPFCIPDEVLVGLVTAAWPRVRLLADEEEVLPGLSVFWTGGHHRSSLAVKVRTERGAAIASDSFFRYENVEQNRPLGINESMEEVLVAYDRIRREADLLIPLYDPRVFERYAGGRVA
jgi:glyoxylase-like metal-dependent hydrolase (beta-lactamase superfamily II)